MTDKGTTLLVRKPTRDQFNYLRHKLIKERGNYMSQDDLVCLLLDHYDYCVLDFDLFKNKRRK
jgi:hypothetical protein